VRYLVIVGLILAAMPAWAADGFTQQDRDMLIELKTRVDQLEKRMDERFEQVDKRFEQVDKRFEQVDRRFEQVNNRFDDMFNFFYILTGIFTAIMVASIGFAFWDRRTVIRQARKEAIEFIEQEGVTRRMLQALRAAAQEDEALAMAMRSFNLL
jgi:predicted PurR-regulated permease PerM